MALENEQAETAVAEASTEAAKASESTFDRSALETKVSGGLAALFSDEPKEDAADDYDSTETTDESNEDTVKGASAGDKDNTASDDGNEETKQELEAAAPPKGNAPTLPDAYRRSLHAYGWEDADIDANLTSLGASFITTAAKIHDNRNQEVAGWAEAGRAARERAKAADTKQVTPEQAAAGQALKPIDMVAVKAHFGEDKMIDQFFAPVNAAIERINSILPKLEASQQTAEQAETAALGNQIEEFFSADGLKPYSKLYGSVTAGLEQGHFNARNKVLEMADALQHGAAQQGRKLSLKDALQTAHDSISTGFKVSAVRTEIKKTLKTRQAGITLKPSNKGTVAGSGPVKSKADLEKRTASRLKAVFG